MDVTADERARLARALWGYSMLSVEDLADKVDVRHATFKAYVARTNPNDPGEKLLSKLIQVVGAPDFSAYAPPDRLQALEEEVRLLRAEHVGLAEVVAQRTEAARRAIDRLQRERPQ